MKNFGLVAAGAIGIGIIAFSMATPQAEDRKSSWSPVLFESGACEGVPAKVSGGEGRLAWDASKEATIAVPAKVRWRRGEGADVVLRGDANDLERIRFENGTLKACGEMDAEIEIVLPGRAFEKVTIAGAGELVMERIDQDEIELMIAGAGKIEADGRTSALKLTIAGAGDAHVGKLATKRLDLNIVGAGGAEASPSEDADIRIVGAGEVELLTRPVHHDFDIFGAGEVNMPNNT